MYECMLNETIKGDLNINIERVLYTRCSSELFAFHCALVCTHILGQDTEFQKDEVTCKDNMGGRERGSIWTLSF